MFVYKIILFMFYLAVSQSRLPDKVFCVNKECSEPISKAKTLLNYNSGDPDLMSFRGKAEAIVYMKSAGTNRDLWYVKINEKSGFVNSDFLRETKIYVKNPEFINPLEIRKKETEVVQVQPDKVQQAHEVIEGTTIYSAESTSPEPGVTTEIPPTVTESATPQLNSNDDPSLLEKSQGDSETSDTDNENSVEQNSSSEQSEDNAEATYSVPSQSLTQLDTESGEKLTNEASNGTPTLESRGEVESEKKVNNEEGNQVHPFKLPETVPKSPLVIVSENLKVPENVDNVQNTTPTPESSNVTEINMSTPSSSVEDSENIIQVIDPTETPNVPSNNITPTQQQELPTQQPPTAQDTDILSSFLSNKDPNLLLKEQDSEIHKIPDEVNSEIVSQETNGELNINKSDINLPSDTLSANPAGLATNPEQLNENNQINEQAIDSVKEKAILETGVAVEEPPKAPLAIPGLPPLVTDNIPAISLPHTRPAENILETQPPSSSEHPPVYQEPQAIPPTTETLPPIFNTQTEITETEPQESSIPGVYSYTFSTKINKVEETTTDANDIDNFSTTEAPLEDIYSANPEPNNEITNDASTEIPVQEESSEGFLSNMYSTLADAWPSSTAAPPSLFNTEAYPTFEEEKIDGKTEFSFMSYIMSTYYSLRGVNEDIKALFTSHGETCYTDEYCDGKSEQSNRFLTFLVTAASSVLLFTLGYYYIDNKRQDGKLIGQINSLQRDLLFSTKECELLKEELSTTKNKLAGIEDSSFGMDDMVQSLKEEINELKATNDRLRHSLDDNEKLLRVSENTAGELQNTLGEVENTLSELLGERANSEEQINELNAKIQAFEEELISVSRERDNYQLKYVSAETALEESKKYKKQLDDINQQFIEAKNTIELQRHEITALKDAIKELKGGGNANADATSLIDHTAIKAKLSKALEEKNSLASKYEVEYTERKRLSEELQVTQESLRTTSQQATEALTRLEVLGKYFQERESELMKELSAKESLYLSKQGESASTIEKIELMQQEVQRYKEKCDALTLELAEQESSRRSAVSEVEGRAHSAWLEARAARREADAARDEAATLRRKLASLAAADGAASPHHKVTSPLGLEGVLPPPLPLPFLPPPLLPPLPRPPPLGRLPSPHPQRYGDRRYTPDSRYSPESRFSPESRYSPETVRYSPESRYSPRSRHDAYSPRSRRRSRERYDGGRGSRTRNGPAADTETEYNSDSPTREPPRRRRYSRHSGSSGSGGYSSGSDK